MKSNSAISTHSSSSYSSTLLSSQLSLSSSSPATASSSSSSSSPSVSSTPSSSSSTSSSSTMKHIILSVAILVLYACTVSQACFIRNCPKGGKRALNMATVAQRPCISCGPGNSGQCVGPQICCSPQFGCHMGSPHSDVCGKENESTTPCYVQGDVCGPRDSGKCVADGICCDSETCTAAAECDAPISEKRDQERVLMLLERLLKAKSTDNN